MHADGQGLGKNDRLLSSFTVLQDTTSAHGPTEVFFPSELTSAHATSAGKALVAAADGEYGSRFEKIATASPALRRLAKRLRAKFGVTKNGEKGGSTRAGGWTRTDDAEDPVETLRDKLVREHVYRSKKTNMSLSLRRNPRSSMGTRRRCRVEAPRRRGRRGSKGRYNIGVTASLRQGSTLVYDSRALHRGSANKADRQFCF